MSTGDKNGDENVVICEQSTSPKIYGQDCFHRSIVVYNPDIGMERVLCHYIFVAHYFHSHSYL